MVKAKMRLMNILYGTCFHCASKPRSCLKIPTETGLFVFMHHRRILCTLQFPLLMSNKFCNEGERSEQDGPSRAIKFLYTPEQPEQAIKFCIHLLSHPPQYGPRTPGLLYIKPPMHLWFIQPCA